MFGLRVVNNAAYLARLAQYKVELERVAELKSRLARAAFPTGLGVPVTEKIKAELQQPGRAVLDGVKSLLVAHIWEQSGEAFDVDSVGEVRAYHVGGAAALEQFRVDLLERLRPE